MKSTITQNKPKSSLFSYIILHFKFFIIHSLFLILMLFLSSCSSSATSSSNSATLNGKVILCNDLSGSEIYEEDNSGITVALYSLCVLDTTIERINKQFSHIGVIINQQTEFDHRFQEAIYSTETNISGDFTLPDLNPDTYNLVAYKENWGWKYICEVTLVDGENTLANVLNTSPSSSKSSEITLYAELTIPSDYISYPGNITKKIEIKPNHHLVILEDAVLATDSRFILHPNSICRIASGSSLNLYGEITMQGADEEFFTVLSDTSEAYLNIYNSATIANGKFHDLTQIKAVNSENISLNSIIFNECNGVEIYDNNEVEIRNTIINDSNAGFNLELCSNINFESNILHNNNLGLNIKQIETDISVINNYFSSDRFCALQTWSCNGSIMNNQFEKNIVDYRFTGSDPTNTFKVTLKENNFQSTNNLFHFYRDTSGFIYTNLYFEKNNFILMQNSLLSYRSVFFQNDIIFEQCYFNGLITELDISNKIENRDNEDDPLEKIEFIEIQAQRVSAGIE